MCSFQFFGLVLQGLRGQYADSANTLTLAMYIGGCEEAVNWVVFKIPLAIHERHLRALQVATLSRVGGPRGHEPVCEP